MKCNPVTCGNAIIPKLKIPIWQKVFEDAKNKLNDEDFGYMIPELKETFLRAESVLNHFYQKTDGGEFNATNTH